MARSPSPLPATPAFVQTPGERAGRFSVRGLSPDPADEKGRGSGPGIRAGDPGRGPRPGPHCVWRKHPRPRTARPAEQRGSLGAGPRGWAAAPPDQEQGLGNAGAAAPPESTAGAGSQVRQEAEDGPPARFRSFGERPAEISACQMASGPEHPTPLGSGPNSCRLRPGRLNGAHSRAALFLGMVFTFGWAALRGRRPSSNFFFPHSFLPSLLLPHLPFPCPRSVAQEDPPPQTNPRVQPRDPSGSACT